MNFRPQFLGLLLAIIIAPAVLLLAPELSSSRLLPASLIEAAGICLIATGIYKKSKSSVKAAGYSLSIGLAAVILSILVFVGLLILAISAI